MSKTKHKYGQYFTEEQLTDLIVSKISQYIETPISFLEPSFGEGQFIKSLLKIHPNAEIDAYEVDKKVFQQIDGANCFLKDFLFTKVTKKYYVIFGNPPYIELPYSFYKGKKVDKFKSLYEKTGRGRTNLVHAFFDRAFDLVEDNGLIIYLIPSTVLTSPWYNDIRKTINDDFTIMELIEDVSFKGVSMQVSLIILKKQKSQESPYMVKKGNAYLISENLNNTTGQTIKEMGFTVGVGKYCWSHYKPELNNNEMGPKLLYSSYITENGIVEIENKNKEKMRNINVDQPTIIQNAIVFPRTSSKKIKMVLIQNNEYAFENHVVYITSDNVNDLVSLYNCLQQNKKEIQLLLNSTTLTKFEVENMVCNF